VLEGVFEEVNTVADFKFYQLLRTTFVELSPFPLPEMEIVHAARGRHLLDCMYEFVSKFLAIQTGEGGHQWTLWQTFNNIVIWGSCYFPLVCCCRCLACFTKWEPPLLEGISAGQLSGAGIKFKSFSKLSSKIRFDKYSATLYLPEITVWDMHTEVVLRNMLALEFNNPTSHLKPVTCYVALMGRLVQSPDDVRRLIDEGVIIRGDCGLTDVGILSMWNGVSQPFCTPSLQNISVVLSRNLEDVLHTNYLKSKFKRTIWGFINVLSTWKFLGSFAVFLGLVLTSIQTYCAVVQLLISSDNNGKPISLWEQV